LELLNTYVDSIELKNTPRDVLIAKRQLFAIMSTVEYASLVEVTGHRAILRRVEITPKDLTELCSRIISLLLSLMDVSSLGSRV